MTMEGDDMTLFLAYLENEMSDSDRNLFEERLRSDESFSNAFEEFKELFSTLENQFSAERAAVLETIQKADAEFSMSNRTESVSEPKVRRLRPWRMGIAASVLLIVGLFLFNNIGKPSYSKLAPEDVLVLTVRSEADDAAKQAERYFNNGDFEESISYLDALLEESPEDAQIQYFKARALVETDQYVEADKLLQSLSEGSSVYVSKATYLRALSFIKQKRNDDAKSILLTIPSDASEYKTAQKLLRKL